jgi:hypothetical protein
VEQAAYRPKYLQFKNSEPPLQHISFRIADAGRFDIDCKNAAELYACFSEPYQKNLAATKMGAVVRGNAARAKVEQEQKQKQQQQQQKQQSSYDGEEEKQMNLAAARIAAIQRGNAARAEVDQKQKAAAKIGAVQRGRTARRQTECLLTKNAKPYKVCLAAGTMSLHTRQTHALSCACAARVISWHHQVRPLRLYEINPLDGTELSNPMDIWMKFSEVGVELMCGKAQQELETKQAEAQNEGGQSEGTASSSSGEGTRLLLWRW